MTDNGVIVLDYLPVPRAGARGRAGEAATWQAGCLRARFCLGVFGVLLAAAPARGQLDETWTVSVNGQTVQVNPDGSFVIPNIPSPDSFGPEGPGSAPDFLSDDFLVVTGFSTAGGVTRYVVSEPFQITQGESFNIGELVVSETPFPFPESIRVVAELDEVLVGATTQLAVTGTRLDGSDFDVTPRKTGTVYRTSNPSIASIGPDGLVAAHRRGTVFVTVVNLNATAVHRIDVISQLESTTVEGFVQLEDGTPVEGAQVTLAKFGGSTLSGADGLFSMSVDVPAGQTVIVSARAELGGQTLVGASDPVPTVPGGITDMGIITIEAPVRIPLFDNPEYVLGRTPTAVEFGDLDRNGALDVVVPLETNDMVSILLNPGNGLLDDPVNYNVAASPTDAAIGDLDGDGDPDVAVASGGCCDPGRVSILLNNGNGTFVDDLPPFVTAAGSNSIVIGNLDGDNDLDLAISNIGKGSGANTISVLLNNGNATFAEQVPYSVSEVLLALAIGNLDGDLDLDLAVTGDVVGDSSYSILLNDGNGIFANQGPQPATPFSVDMVLADAEGDDDLDLAVATHFGDVKFFLNNGDATFVEGPAQDVPGAQRLSRLAAGDIDDDGDDDLAVVRDNNVVTLLFNEGDGTFPADFNVGARSPRRVGLGDLDGNAHLDVVVASTPSRIALVFNNGDGTFGPPSFDTGFSNGNRCTPHGVRLGHWDAGDVLDLAAVSCGGSHVSVLLGNGDGTFASSVPYAVPASANALASGDFDGLNGLDLAVANGGFSGTGNVSILSNNGDGSFSAPVNFTVGTRPVSVAVGHLNDDDSLDLAVADSRSNTVSVLFGNGDGAFADSMPIPVASAQRVAIADTDGDDVNDLVVGKSNRTIAVLLNNSDGTFADALEFPTTGLFSDMAVADVDGDGNVDATVVGGNEVSVLLGHGDGAFAAADVHDFGFPLGLIFVAVVLEDVNGDGLSDVVTANSFSNIAVLLGHGDGTFTLDRPYAAGRNASALAVGDVDKDGDVDVAVSNNPTTPSGAGPDSTVSILLNRRAASAP